MIDRTNRQWSANEGERWTRYASGSYGPSNASALPSGLLFKRGRRAKISDFRLRKCTLLFTCFDNDRNGRIDIADFEQLAECIAEAHDLAPGMTRRALMYAETMAFWSAFKMAADCDNDGTITLDEFVQAYDEMSRRDTTLTHVRTSLVSFLMRMGDRDRDDMLDEHEYTTLLGYFDVPNAGARSAFRRLLAPGALHVNRLALDRAVGEFLCGGDPDAPGTWTFGPLP